MIGTDAASARKVITIVDDDVAVRSSLNFALQNEGFSVRAFASAELLLSEGTDHSDCFVIDHRLPGRNGIELIRTLRQRDIRAPAILITTAPSAFTRQAAAADGVVIVEKPLLGDALFQEIRSALVGASKKQP